jgi:predicted permease
MTIVFSQVFLLLLFGVVGYLLTKTKIADSGHTKLLSCLCLYVFLPAQVFKTFAGRFTLQYLTQKYVLVLGAAVTVTVLALIAIPLSRLLTKHSYQQKIYHYSLTIPNFGYIGYALAEAIFGGETLLDVMMFAMPLSVYTYSVGYCMLTNSKMTVKRLLNPVSLAMVFGAIVGLTGFEMPSVANQFLNSASGCMAPVSMLLTGMVISDYGMRDMLGWWQVYFVAVLRLLVIPCAVGLVLKLLGLDALVLPAIMLLSMPCGMNTIIFPKLLGEDCKTGAAMAFFTTVLCCLTIPLCFILFGIQV